MINGGCFQAVTLLLAVVPLWGQNTARPDFLKQPGRSTPIIS